MEGLRERNPFLLETVETPGLLCLSHPPASLATLRMRVVAHKSLLTGAVRPRMQQTGRYTRTTEEISFVLTFLTSGQPMQPGNTSQSLSRGSTENVDCASRGRRRECGFVKKLLRAPRKGPGEACAFPSTYVIPPYNLAMPRPRVLSKRLSGRSRRKHRGNRKLFCR